MKDCEATTMMVDLAEVEQIVDKLERGEEVGFFVLLVILWFQVCAFVCK